MKEHKATLEINWNKCESDGICVEKCPHKVLEMKNISRRQYEDLTFFGRLRTRVHGRQKAIVVNPKQCIACGICVKVCPKKAIKMITVNN